MRLALVAIVLDEEAVIRRWLAGWRQSAGIFDEVVVVDGGSTDTTVSLLAEAGITVVQHPFPRDFAAQRNVALDLVSAEWVFELDADEVPSVPLLAGLRTIARQCGETGVDVVGIPRLNFHDGQLQSGPGHCGLDFQYRLHTRDTRWQGAVHEEVVGFKGRIELDIGDGHFLRHLKTEARHRERNALYGEING